MNGTDRRIPGVAATVAGLITLWATSTSAPALSTDPNNAALLYCQAIMACPEPDDATREMLHDVLAGAKPNQAVREYVEDCTQAMVLMEEAARMPSCDWSVVASFGQGPAVELRVKGRNLASVLGVDAHIHALAGHYRTALARCVLMCRAASHGGNRNVSPCATAFEDIGHGTVRYILGLMRPDVDTLTWLKHELASTRVVLPPLVEAVEADIELVLQSVRANNKIIARLRGDMLRHADESRKPEIEQMTDERLLDLVRQSHVGFINEASQILADTAPYRDTYAQLEELEARIREQARNDPAVALLMATSLQRITQHYTARARRQASSNALEAALELYMEAARAGRLPKRLPHDRPRDPLTGEDFDYEITKRGFVLRSQSRDIPGDYGVDLAFRVPDPNLLRQPEPWETPTETRVKASNTDAVVPSEPDRVGTPEGARGTAGKKVQYESANDLEAVMQDEEMPAEVRERA